MASVPFILERKWERNHFLTPTEKQSLTIYNFGLQIIQHGRHRYQPG